MEKNILETRFKFGTFMIGVEDLVFIDLDWNERNNFNILRNYHKEIYKLRDVPLLEKVEDLEKRGMTVGDNIKERIRLGFFSNTLYYPFDRIVIIKGRSTFSHILERLIIKDGYPSDFHLVPANLTFDLAYTMSLILTKEFLNFHNMDQVIIMSNPLEKLSQNDDDLAVKLDPSYHKCITTAWYTKNSGDRHTGYLFFC